MKRNTLFSRTLILIAVLAAAASAASRRPAEPITPDIPSAITVDSADVKPADVKPTASMRTLSEVENALAVEDSLAEEIYREEEGQDFSSLFDHTDPDNHMDVGADGFMEIDTVFAWSNVSVNSGRFDYKTLGPEDTIRIPLVDTARGKRFVHPFQGIVTSPFGPRRFLWHYGMDVKLNVGDTVNNAFDGIVRVVQYDRRGYGNVVVVRHHNGLETVYGHLSKTSVQPNQRISAGDPVGLGGSTGRSSGPHLHFETRYFGEPFDPRHIIQFAPPYELKSDTLVLTKENFDYLTEVRKTITHTVRRGETLGSIARRYGTTVNNLCRLNGITPRTTLSVGRRLVIRSGKTAERQVVAAPAAKATARAPTAKSDIVADGSAIGGAEMDDGDDLEIVK